MQDSDPKTIKKVARLFAKQPGIAEVLTAEDLAEYKHRSPAHAATSCSFPSRTVGRRTTGGIDDAKAPHYARTVDIHRKPGYDPVELFFDARSKSIPLNANLVRGSHGAPATRALATRRAAHLRTRRLPRRPARRHRSGRDRAQAVRGRVAIERSAIRHPGTAEVAAPQPAKLIRAC